METNFLVILGAAVVPMVMGFIWYSPILFEKAWMKEMNFTKEDVQKGNMALIFGLSFLFSLMLAFALQMLVIHQWGIFSTLVGEPGFNEKTGVGYETYIDLMNTYGDRFRTFKHGAFHGFFASLLIALPIIGTKALFERKSFKYIAINVGYWLVTITLMGGIICQWA